MLTKSYSNELFVHLYYRFRGLAKRPEMDRELVIILNTDDTKVTPENFHEYLAIALRCSRDKGKDIVNAYYSANGTLRELENLMKLAYDQGKRDGAKAS